MKRMIVFFALLVSSLSIFALETKKVAVLEVVDKENKLTYHQKLMLRSSLAEEINNVVGFEAYDRSNIDVIMSEHNFQRTGYVSSDQIRQLGQMAGAAYILVIEGAVSSQGNLFVSANILDVETAAMAVSASENMALSEEGMKRGCASLAKKLFTKLNAASVSDIKAEQANYKLHKSGNKYLYGSTEMDHKAYANFLKNNCPSAYKQYQQGKKLTIAGWTLFGVGLATAAGGGAYYYLLENYAKKCQDLPYWNELSETRHTAFEKDHNKYRIIGYSIMGIGAAVFVTSIPILSSGNAKQKKSVSMYNENCSKSSTPPLTFNLTAGPNGLGIAMNF